MEKTNIREIFSLPETEEIFDDFSCKEGTIAKGRMYLTTNYMCYFSNLLGKQKKIVIKWEQIVNIAKHDKKDIKVMSQNHPEIVFKEFTERNTSFKFIRRLWANSSPHAQNLQSDSDSEEESQEILTPQSRSMSKASSK